MAIDRLYFGSDTSRAQLEAWRKQAYADKASGKRTTMIFAAGVKTEKKIEVGITTVLFQIEHDLCKRWPQDYDAAVLMPVRHARPRYLYN